MQQVELMQLQMSSIDFRVDELRDGLSEWGKGAGRKASGNQTSVETEQAKLAYATASDSLAKLEVRRHHFNLPCVP